MRPVRKMRRACARWLKRSGDLQRYRSSKFQHRHKKNPPRPFGRGGFFCGFAYGGVSMYVTLNESASAVFAVQPSELHLPVTAAGFGLGAPFVQPLPASVATTCPLIAVELKTPDVSTVIEHPLHES